MILNKVIHGYVVQEFDTILGDFVSQEFIGSMDITWETELGDPADAPENETYLPVEMVQPDEMN